MSKYTFEVATTPDAPFGDLISGIAGTSAEDAQLSAQHLIDLLGGHILSIEKED